MSVLSTLLGKVVLKVEVLIGINLEVLVDQFVVLIGGLEVLFEVHLELHLTLLLVVHLEVGLLILLTKLKLTCK